MIYTTLTKEDAFIRLSDGGSNTMVIPSSEAIIVDDGSELLTIKAKGTRKNIAQVKK